MPAVAPEGAVPWLRWSLDKAKHEVGGRFRCHEQRRGACHAGYSPEFSLGPGNRLPPNDPVPEKPAISSLGSRQGRGTNRHAGYLAQPVVSRLQIMPRARRSVIRAESKLSRLR